MAKTSENNQTNIICLNYMFYTNGQFSQGTGTHNYYSPQLTWTANDNWITYQNGSKTTKQEFKQTYLDSVSYTTGWFTPAILNAEKLTQPPSQTPRIYTVRYNPNIDTGQGNKIWLKSKFKHDWSPPQTESYLILADEPLWLLFFGWLDYINTLKPAYHIFEDYLVVIESPYFKQPFTQPQQYIVPIDESFTQGKGPFNSTPYLDKNKTWIPSLKHQQQSINNIVKCGPYITKPEGKYSNWELHLKYTFFFKWGGAQPPAADIYNPTQGSTYPVPDHYQQRIQIKDPTKVIPQTILHTWDYRRGDITKKALKRMYDYLSDATTISTDSEFQEPLQKQKNTARQVLGEDKNKDTLECLQKLIRRRLIAERRENTLHRRPHRAAATTAAQHQTQPPQTPHKVKACTITNATTNRDSVKNRKFKPGFETDTERELAIAFHRPPRTYVNDPPFYPWLPIAPKVCFNLNFKD